MSAIAGAGSISFPFSSATARSLWSTIAASVLQQADGTPGRAYGTWYTSASAPLINVLTANAGSYADGDFQTFQAQVTKLEFLLRSGMGNDVRAPSRLTRSTPSPRRSWI